MLFDRMGAGLTGRTSQGFKLYEDGAPLGDKIWAAVAHTLNGFIPAGSPLEFNPKMGPQHSSNFDPWRSFTLGNLTQAALVESGMVDASRLSRISERKKKLDVYDEAFQAASGIKFIESEVEKKLRYKIQEAKPQFGTARSFYEDLKKEYGAMLPEEVSYRFQQANANRFKKVRDLSIAFDDARTLGLSEEKIAKIVRDVGGLDGWRGILNHIYIPMAPKASVSIELYRAAADKRRNVAPAEAMSEEVARSYREDRLPQRPTPQPMAPDLTEVIPEAVRGAVEAIPQQFDQISNRASQFLRQQEEEKLMGGS
jgi:hypothetical protein